MSRQNRGGLTLKTGKIGRLNCLRQQILMPGERMNINISGKVRLESLRERDVMRINAGIYSFMTPLRWLEPNFPTYVKEGADTAQTLTGVSRVDWSKLGIGSSQALGIGNIHHQFWEDNYLRVFNEWFKWPEDTDKVAADIDAAEDGLACVPLSSHWTRARDAATPDDTNDEVVSSATSFRVQDLAEVQAKFRGAMKRDVLSFNRWMELVKHVWKGDGSREVDQVPIMLDQSEVGVNPRDLPATDGASLGQWQSLYDFNVNHSIRGVIAPEHCIVSHFLVIRFAPIIEQGMPLAKQAELDWYEQVGDPEWFAAAEPVDVQFRHFMLSSSSTSIGYLPSGWQWRCGHDVIGKQIDVRDTFPMMDEPVTKADCRDATRVKDAFRSQGLGDYLCDIYFSEDSIQPMANAIDSYFSGMADHTQPYSGGNKSEFPHGGKNL